MPERRCSCYRPITRKGRAPCPHNPTRPVVVDSHDPVGWLLWLLAAGMAFAAWKAWG